MFLRHIPYRSCKAMLYIVMYKDLWLTGGVNNECTINFFVIGILIVDYDVRGDNFHL